MGVLQACWWISGFGIKCVGSCVVDGVNVGACEMLLKSMRFTFSKHSEQELPQC